MVENKNRLRTPAQVEEIEDVPVKKTKAKPEKTVKPKKKPESKVAKRRKESDGRVRVCFGIFFLIVSVFLLIAMGGPYFGHIHEALWLKSLGTFLSKEMFGIGTAYFIFLIGLLGVCLIVNRSLIKAWALWKYGMMILLWLPVFLAAVKTPDIYHGRVGYRCLTFLTQYIGLAGVVLLLIFTALIFIVFTFNIKINFKRKENNGQDPSQPAKIVDEGPTEVIFENDTDDNAEEIEDEEVVEDEENNEDEAAQDDEADDENEVIEENEIIEENDVDENDANDKDEVIEENEEDDDVEITVVKKQDQSNNIEMEVEDQVKEKQVKENGEHFGLDTFYDPKLELSDFKLPPLDLLRDYGEGNSVIDREELEANKKRIVDTLANYSIEIDKIKATIGPTVTLYEIVPAAGVRISKIRNLQDDIALSLSALGIRIIAPIPGKGTVGIEVPNKKPQTVSMRSVIGSEKFQTCGYALPFGIGKTISNESYVADLAKMPHILMAGATGQGKSVGLNAIIASLLYSKHPAELKFILVDPKKVELSLYRKIERHYLAKLPDSEDAIITDVRKVVRTLNSLCIEMDNRYELMKDAGVRNIKEYNEKFTQRKLNPLDGHRFMPYIVLVVDEFADLIMTAGREVEGPIARLAQLARAIGIHLIIATQRPSVKIITGTIKANFPARIAFRVISRVDSATILDNNGAEQLIGRGDMLMSTGQDLVRLQCPFIDTPEVEAICDYIGAQRGYAEAYELPDCPDEQDDSASKDAIDPDERDPLFEEAARIVVQTQQGSTSMLQRKLKLGYNRAGRIIDQLEKAGIVGPFAGSKQREVKVATEFALDQFLKDLDLDENIKNNGMI